MDLSSNMISELVKVTKPETPKSNGSTVYGIVKIYNGQTCVKIDGSDIYTPVNSTVDVKDDDRVMVLIKNHTATVTGNTTDISASSDRVIDVEKTTSYKPSEEELTAVQATIENLKVKVGSFENLTAEELTAVLVKIETLEAKYANITHISTSELKALVADIDNLKADIASFGSVSTEDLEAVNAYIEELRGNTANFKYVVADRLEAQEANIKKLDVEKLNASFANIIFANMDTAKIEELFAGTGIIKELITSTGTVTGELVGVTIRGDLIQANTLYADAIVLRGEDGLFYKLNTNGVGAEALTDDYKITDVELTGVNGTVVEGFRVPVIADIYSYDNGYFISIDGLRYKVNHSTYVNTNNIVEVKSTYTIRTTENYTASGEAILSIYDENGQWLWNVVSINDTYYDIDNGNEFKATNEIISDDIPLDFDNVIATIEAEAPVYVYDEADGDKGHYCQVNGKYYAVEYLPNTVKVEQNEFNSLDGKNILAESITATHIKVDDLFTFNATIGGFKINEDSINSVTKTSVDNTTRGFYVDNDGQFNVGDSNNFIKFYRHVDTYTEYTEIEAHNGLATDFTVSVNVPVFVGQMSGQEIYYCLFDGVWHNVTYDGEKYTVGSEIEEKTPTSHNSGTVSVNIPVYSYMDGDDIKYYCVSSRAFTGLPYTAYYDVIVNIEYKLDISASDIQFGLRDQLDKLTERVKIGQYEDPTSSYQVYEYTKDNGIPGYYCIVDSAYYIVEHSDSGYKRTTGTIDKVDGTPIPDTFTVADMLPSIELSEDDSEFKQIITNKGAIYSDGSNELTKINTDGIETDDLTLRGDHIQGNWSWKVDDDGGYGLVWIGGTE